MPDNSCSGGTVHPMTSLVLFATGIARPKTLACLTGLAIMVAIGCAARQIPAAPGPPNEPRASWIIRSGEYGAEREVCRSDANRPCVLEASGSQPVSVVVSVFLFPTDAPTTYRGAFMSAFIPGADGKGYESKVDYKIDAGRQPTAVSVVGRVTKQAGDYPFRMALFAEVPGHTDPHQFQQTFAVHVVAKESVRAMIFVPF